MRIHRSSTSRLAIIAAAALALPGAAAATQLFEVRDGQVIPTRLDLPAEGAEVRVGAGSGEIAGFGAPSGSTATVEKTGAGRLILSGQTMMENGVIISGGSLQATGQLFAPVSIRTGAALIVSGLASTATVDSGGTVIVDGSMSTVTSEGMVVNNRGITNLTMNDGVTLNNGDASILYATVNGGALTNSGSIRDVSVAAGAGFVNNESGSIRGLINNGISSNDGSVYSVQQRGGSFTNGAEGSVYGYSQSGGVGANSGSMTYASVSDGTLTNNEGGRIDQATASDGGTLLNGGAITQAIVEAGGSLTNNRGGVIETLANAGAVTNDGQIGNLTQTAGSLVNNGTVLGLAAVEGGTMTNNYALGTVEVGAGGTFTNNEDGFARGLTNAGTVSNAGAIRFVTQSAGTFVNEAEGSMQGMTVSGGSLTNSGGISSLLQEGGSVAVNAGGTVGIATITAGSFTNSGTVTRVEAAEGTQFVNNASGNAGTVITAAGGSNAGRVGVLNVNGGAFANSGLIADEAVIAAGASLSSTGVIDGPVTNDGVLDISGIAGEGIANGAAATLNLTGDLLAGGVLANNGTLNSSGGHTVNGLESLINAGTMNVDGTLALETGNLVSSGVIRLNGDAGTADTLSAAGDVTLSGTSAVTLNVDAEGGHDTLSAGGAMTLGGRLTVEAAEGDYGLRTAFSAFTSAAGELAGDFADIVVTGVDGLFAAVGADGDGGTALVLRSRDALAGRIEGQLDGQSATDAATLVAGMDFSGNDGAAVFDAVAGLDEDGAAGLVAQITGTAAGMASAAGDAAARGFGEVMQKVASAAGFGGGDRVSSYQRALKEEVGEMVWTVEEGDGDGRPVYLVSNDPSRGAAWVRGFGETGGGANTGGVAAGLEMRVGDAARIGVSAGYSLSDGGSGAISAQTASMHGGAYLSYGATAPDAAGFGLTANAAYSLHDTEQTRRVVIGALTETLSASIQGSTLSGSIIARHGFQTSEGAFTLAPVAGVKFAFSKDEGYTETGNATLAQTVSASSRQSLQGVIGVQAAARIETAGTVVIVPHVTALYQHEFGDTGGATTRSIAGSGDPFSVSRAGGSRSSVAVEAGIGFALINGLSVDLSGYGVFGDETVYGGTATLKARF